MGNFNLKSDEEIKKLAARPYETKPYNFRLNVYDAERVRRIVFNERAWSQKTLTDFFNNCLKIKIRESEAKNEKHK